MKKIAIILAMALFCLVSGVMSAQTDKVVRILAIGNSFSEDAVEQHLHDIAAADGVEVIIGNMYIGGCSLQKHLNNARKNKPAYKYRKIGLDGKKVETKEFTLEAGDSVYFNPRIPHGQRAAGVPSRFLTIINE